MESSHLVCAIALFFQATYRLVLTGRNIWLLYICSIFYFVFFVIARQPEVEIEIQVRLISTSSVPPRARGTGVNSPSKRLLAEETKYSKFQTLTC